MKLSGLVIERLGYYVYLYVNPFDDSVFYVGAGRGSRALGHLEDKSETEKVRVIRAIRAQGKEPQIEILVHGLPDAETALRVEGAVIDLIGLGGALTNRRRGQGSRRSGRIGLSELVALYDRDPVRIEEPSILVRINRLYRYGMSDMELYDATRGVWKVGANRDKASYAFAVFRGVVREVYRIAAWLRAGSTFSTRPPENLADPERWEFVGTVAEEAVRSKYLLRSVQHLLPAGSQNPICYVNIRDYSGAILDYRDAKGKTRKRKRCYPSREQGDTNTLCKARSH